MKTFIVVFVLFSVTSFTKLVAQTLFARTNSHWFYKNDCSDPYDCGYFQVEVIKDTLIDGAESKIVIGSENGTKIPESKLIIKSDNGKVYFLEDSQFKLLFDFTLSKGDTLYYNIPGNFNYYDIAASILPPSRPSKARAVVSSVSRVEVEGVELKVLELEKIFEDEDSEYITWNLGKITELLGSDLGFLGHSDFRLPGFVGYFRCHIDLEIFHNATSEFCDYIAGNLIGNPDSRISVSPNPSADILSVSGVTAECYRIYDNLGKLILQGNLNDHKEIDVRALKPGHYYILFKRQNYTEIPVPFIKI